MCASWDTGTQWQAARQKCCAKCLGVADTLVCRAHPEAWPFGYLIDLSLKRIYIRTFCNYCLLHLFLFYN